MARKRKPTYDELVDLLRDIATRHFHEPDSDAYEYCPCCSRSPYNVPPHDDDCLVPRIADVLARVR